MHRRRPPICVSSIGIVKSMSRSVNHVVSATVLSFTTRSFAAVTGRHSKNVAAKKNKLDAVKTKIYNKIATKIIVAAKSGGTNTATNANLARILKEAESIKLPKENIERALKKAEQKDTAILEAATFELFLHGRVALIVASLTDSTTRTNKRINEIANKNDIKVASTGSIIFQFEKKGIFLPHHSSDLTEDKVIELVLDTGYDDVELYNRSDERSDDGDSGSFSALLLTNPNNLNELASAVDAKQLAGTSSIGYIPNELIEVTDEIYHKNMAIIDKFLEEDDVEDVYHNMK